MNFSYQFLGVQAVLLVTGVVALYVLFGAPILKLREQKLKKEIKLLRKRTKTADDAAAGLEVEPTEITVRAPAPKTDAKPTSTTAAPQGPVYFKGQWYSTVAVASKFHKVPESVVIDECTDEQDGRSLWDDSGHFDVAQRHRLIRVGGRKRLKLIVSDYAIPGQSENRCSRAFFVRNHQRLKLDVQDQLTGSDTLAFFKNAAEESLLVSSA